MLNISKKLKDIGRTRLLLIIAVVTVIMLLSGVAVCGVMAHSHGTGDRQSVETSGNSMSDKKPATSKNNSKDKKPSKSKDVPSDSDTIDTPSEAVQSVDQSNEHIPTKPVEPPIQTQSPNDEYVLVVSASSVILGTSDVHPRCASIIVRYKSGSNIEFLQISKQPEFQVSSIAYVGSIVAHESSLAGTDAVRSRTLVICQLATESAATTGTVYVTTNPNSAPVAVRISWSPAN